MIVLICYDVAVSEDRGARRLRRVAEACRDHGVRVQYSVFECRVDGAAWVRLRHRLLEEIDPAFDSLRFYFINDADAARTEHLGVREPLDPTATLVV